VVVPGGAQARDTQEQAFLARPIKRGQSLVYYAGAGWSKSGDFPDKDSSSFATAWIRHVSAAAGRSQKP